MPSWCGQEHFFIFYIQAQRSNNLHSANEVYFCFWTNPGKKKKERLLPCTTLRAEGDSLLSGTNLIPPLTAEARVQFQARPCEVCGRQSGTD